MKEIKIFRTDITSVTDAVSWSSDGQLAVNSGTHVTILTPTITKESIDEEYTQRQTPQLDQGVNFMENNYGFYYDEKFSMTTYATENAITDIIWSPTGSSARRGCLLSVLTTRGEVCIYEPLGNPAFAEWKVKYHLNQQMIEECDIEKPLRNNDVMELRFHSIEWSGAYPWVGSKWGTSFVIAGAENDTLVLFQHDDEGLRFLEKWNGGLEGTWVTQLRMSGKDNEQNSLLAFSNELNELAVKKIRYNAQAMKIESDDNIQLLNKSRLRISAMRWWSTPDMFRTFLVTYQTGYLHLFVFDQELNIIKADLKVISPWSKECSGIVIYPINEQVLKVVATSCQGDVLAAEYDGNTDEFVHAPENTINNFVSRRRDLSVDDDVEFALKMYSASPHPHGRYMAVLYSVYQAQKFKYPVLSESVRRVAFLPTQTISPNDVYTISSIMEGSALCSWWEIGILMKCCNKKEKDVFKNNLIQGTKQEVDKDTQNVSQRMASDNLGQDLEATLLANPTFDRLRLLQHYGYDHHLTVLKALATTTLKFVHKLGDLELTDIDRAVLQSYSHFIDDPKLAFDDSSNEGEGEPITITGGFFEEKFEFTKPMNETAIISCSDHTWPRCSITLLPLLGVNVLTCSGCGRKAVHASTLPENPGKLTEVILDTLDVCIYCGGRYYERQ